MKKILIFKGPNVDFEKIIEKDVEYNKIKTK